MTASAMRRWLLTSAAVGGVAWVGIALLSTGDAPWLSEYEVFFLLAPLVVVPLALGLPVLRFEPELPRLLAVACAIQPAAAWMAAAAFAFEPGGLAGALTLPWLVVCLLVAFSARDVLHFRWRNASEGISKAGMLYLAVGGMALSLSRAGAAPLHFNEPVVLLTGVHFHFTGFATPVFAGSLIGGACRVRRLEKHGPTLVAAAAALLAATSLLAVGWVLDSAAWKLLCVLVIVAGVSMLAAGALRLAFAARSWLLGILLTISSLSVLFGMVLAGLYAAGEFAGESFISLQAMARLHGAANGLGFGSCGLLAMNLLESKAASLQESQGGRR